MSPLCCQERGFSLRFSSEHIGILGKHFSLLYNFHNFTVQYNQKNFKRGGKPFRSLAYNIVYRTNSVIIFIDYCTAPRDT
jgi:hypothetical protein